MSERTGRSIPLFKVYWDEDDVQAVESVIKRGMHWAAGPEIDEFESKTASFLGRKHCVAVNSGTSALHAALLAHGVGSRDEVIVPSFTFIATANAALFVGAKPVFADIEEKYYGLSPSDVENRITEKTKAIIPVHVGGSSCLIDELKEIADRHNVALIEDAAESFGATFKNKKVGSFGDSAIFSFCATKVITTGEGGAVVTDSDEVVEKLRLAISHGREGKNYFSTSKYLDYVSLGYNFRMSSMTAALGISQLKKIGKLIEMRRKNAEYMNKGLDGVDGVEPLAIPPEISSVYQMYTIKTNNKNTRDRLMEHLVKNGITAKVYFYPVHLTAFYRQQGHAEGELPVTERVSGQVLTLPMYPSLSREEMDFIIENIKTFFR